jgi:hypothetical protein
MRKIEKNPPLLEKVVSAASAADDGTTAKEWGQANRTRRFPHHQQSQQNHSTIARVEVDSSMETAKPVSSGGGTTTNNGRLPSRFFEKELPRSLKPAKPVQQEKEVGCELWLDFWNVC